MKNKMNALLLAGGQMAPDAPLFGEAPDGRRSLIKIHGKPMAQWVLDALTESDSIGALYIIGLPEDCGLTSAKPLYFLPDAGGMFENIRAGVLRIAADFPEQEKVMVASADIPSLQPAMVDWLVAQVEQQPEPLLYYNVIPQAVMEQHFPASARSYVHFRDVAVCGGDLNVLDKSLFTIERPIWKSLTESRKNPLKQASLLGFDTLLLVALRLITLQGAVKKISRKLSLVGQALTCPFAEIGMDADKPHQLAILRQHLDNQP